jgi:hypothetical protein
MPPEDSHEFSGIVANLREGLARHIVQVRAYSVVEPDGELGGVHVAAMIPISKEAFDEFITNGFHISNKTSHLWRDIITNWLKIERGE